MSIVVVTGTGTGVGKTVATAALACHARLAGIDVAVCKPVQTGTLNGHDGDDDLAEIGRLSGVTELVGLARYPQPLAPVAAASAAGMALPTRAELLEVIRGADRPGRLTLVEGAGGLLVELGADAVTLRDLAVDLGAPVIVVVAPALGTLNYTALTMEALAAKGDFVCGTDHRFLAGATGRRRGGQPHRPAAAGAGARRTALGGGLAVGGRLRGAGGRRVRWRLDFESGRLMVHSVELVFDADTEALLRRIWDDLRDAGIPSQAPAARPHATLTVAERIDPAVDTSLAPLAARFPFPCRIGAPLLFGRADVLLARLVVPTIELLELHADVHRLCLPFLVPGPDGAHPARPVDRTRHPGSSRRRRSTRTGTAHSGPSVRNHRALGRAAPLGR